jgi:hypothetical protein
MCSRDVVYLWIEDEPPAALEEGCFYQLSCVAVFRSKCGVDRVVRHHCAGDAAAVTLVGGRFTFENDVTDLLLRHLPPLI